MKLLSATVRAYRLHRETTVVFDPHRTLIGGPNEAGKSTFAEAIHRALFLKAKGNTSDHRGMKSTVHPGTPEVELGFECGGAVYQVKKRFGASGETLLTPLRGVALTGEAAEAELARVLGVEAGASGKTALGQWSHLWVWQGQSADDPTPHATSQRDSLLQRLQTLGGAAAMQSSHDSRTAAAVAAAHDEIFTNSGKVKVGSALASAEAAAVLAEAAVAAARARQESLTDSVRNHFEAESQLTRLHQDMIVLAEQQEAATRQEQLIRSRRAEEAGHLLVAEAAAARLVALEKQEGWLAEVRRELAALEAELAPLDDATGTLTEQALHSQQHAAGAGREVEEATDAASLARQEYDLAQAWMQEHEMAGRLAELGGRAAQVARHEEEAARLRLEWAGMPPVDGPALAILQKAESAWHAAQAALQAMAAEVEFLAGDGPVLLGGVKLAPGESKILTDVAELNFSHGGRLRIRPGGGTSLAEARERCQAARRNCLAALEKYGVPTVEEGAAVAARRANAEARLMAEQTALKSLKAGALGNVLAEARADLAAAQADTARRRALLPETSKYQEASDKEAAEAFVAVAAGRLAEAEAVTARSKAQRDAAVRTATSQAQALLHHQESLRERQQRRTGLVAQLELLLGNHGSDEARAAALAEAQQQVGLTGKALAKTRQALTELQPEHHERTLERLQRSTEELQRQRSAAETKRAVAADQLRSDGMHDPVAALALATSRGAEAEETVLRLQRQAEARRLLHEVFTREQAMLAERFTQPLADRISGYLECLFGVGTRAVVELGEDGFTGLNIHRPSHLGGAFAFDHLSGGTREQTAAAVRLAMAEVLAVDHDGTLPVIFDDAFAYSDAVRLGHLQNMLDLAASRGLQVILFTHQPAAYAALGAKVVALS